MLSWASVAGLKGHGPQLNPKERIWVNMKREISGKSGLNSLTYLQIHKIFNSLKNNISKNIIYVLFFNYWRHLENSKYDIINLDKSWLFSTFILWIRLGIWGGGNPK